MQTSKRLYRSRTDSVIGGVSGGLGKYFNIDPIVIRILFVVLALAGGGGVLIYAIAWMVTPLEPYNMYYTSPQNNPNNPSGAASARSDGPNPYDEKQTNPEFDNTILNPDDDMRKKQAEKQRNEGSLIAGIILITLGGLFLAGQFIPRINFGDLWPVLLIVVGILIIFGSSRNGKR